MTSTSNTPSHLLKLAQNLQLSQAKGENFVFSPCSIQLALSLLANGSAGSTLKELLTFLDANDLDHLNSAAAELVNTLAGPTEGGPKISFVRGAWINTSCSLNPIFETVAGNIYHAKAKAADFGIKGKAVIEEANKWAGEASNGLINSVLPLPLHPRTRVLLANALYFKGTWRNKFNRQDTRQSKFYLLDGNSIQALFMTTREDQYIKTCQDCKVLRLPYQTSLRTATASFSMYIILPNERDGLWSVVEKAGSDPLFLETYVCPDKRKVRVREFKVPKFKMTFEFDACEVLKSTGINLPFSDDAELDEMVLNLNPDKRLKVSKLNHKSYIEVNEEGTEAASVTTSGFRDMMSSGHKIEYVDFVADHPFMFLVREDKSGMVLFMGHVISPFFSNKEKLC